MVRFNWTLLSAAPRLTELHFCPLLSRMGLMMRKTLLVLALVFTALPGVSQVATGLYPYGSFDNFGFDSIDRGSLNVHFSIPVISKSGRGLPFEYSLIYDG